MKILILNPEKNKLFPERKRTKKSNYKVVTKKS